MLQTRTYPAAQWAQAQAQALPLAWRARVLTQWERARDRAQGAGWIAQDEAQRAANIELREVCAQLTGATRAGLDLDATDAELCQRAEELAAECFALATAAHLRSLPALRAAMGERVKLAGLQPPKMKGEKGRPGRAYEDGPAVARMTCAHWWRRGLRKLHARTVEGAAIRLGVVNAKAQPYVSDESLKRRIAQNERNAQALASTLARNEAGQEFTLAELSAKGTANKAIRRAELMTRIAGFERIALDMGHAGLFMTITCPSRMHRWRGVFHGRRLVKVIPNPKFDGTNPREANEYLGKVWARVRAALHRGGIRLYGFRIAEPQHDGTPHWHCLFFHEPRHADEIRRIVREHALRDSGDEAGADVRRVDFVAIDRDKGTAAGYIAKYVAKNIDGYRVDKDLLGNDALETSARVEAWAATWRIRQFQQIGGAPVGVWRELRRVETVPEDAPAHLRAAWRAVNKMAQLEGREHASVAWDHYTQAQGGVFVGRSANVKLAKAPAEGIGRYGEELPDAVIGVKTLEVWRPEWMRHINGCAVRWLVVESSRQRWQIVGRTAGASVESPRPQPAEGVDPWARRQPWADADALAQEAASADERAAAEDAALSAGPAKVNPNEEKQAKRAAAQAAALAGHRRSFAQRAQPAKPRTCVNNCTEGGQTDGQDQGAGAHGAGACAHERHARGAAGGQGRFHQHQPPVPGPGGAGHHAPVPLH